MIGSSRWVVHSIIAATNDSKGKFITDVKRDLTDFVNDARRTFSHCRNSSQNSFPCGAELEFGSVTPFETTDKFSTAVRHFRHHTMNSPSSSPSPMHRKSASVDSSIDSPSVRRCQTAVNHRSGRDTHDDGLQHDARLLSSQGYVLAVFAHEGSVVCLWNCGQVSRNVCVRS